MIVDTKKIILDAQDRFSYTQSGKNLIHSPSPLPFNSYGQTGGKFIGEQVMLDVSSHRGP